MNWLVGAVVGDVFRWCLEPTIYGTMRNDLCKITRFKDSGIEVHFEYLTGDRVGQHGYTILPQDVELVSAVERLGNLARDL